VDRVGAKAREARGAEPPAARGDGHDVPATPRRRRPGSAGGPLRHHARRGHAPSARRGGEARRRDGAAVELPGLRRARLARRERPRDPPAAREADASDRRIRHDLPAGLLGPRGTDPYAFAADVSAGDLFDEGSTPARASTTWTRSPARWRGGAGQRAPVARPLRGTLRARGLVSDLELFEGFGPLRRGGDAHPPMGPRRLATASVGLPEGPDAGRHAGEEPDLRARPLEDRGQPSPQPVAASRGRHAARRVAPRPRGLLALDRFHPRDDLRPEPSLLSPESCSPAPARDRQKELLPAPGGGSGDVASPGGASRRLPRRPGGADDRRDRPHARAPLPHAAAAARVDSRAPGEAGARPVSPRAPAPHGVRRGLRVGRRPAPRRAPSLLASPGVPAAGGVGRLPAVAGGSASRRAPGSAAPGGRRPEALRAVARKTGASGLSRPRGQLPSARQLPAGPRAGRRPRVADEHRPGPPRQSAPRTSAGSASKSARPPGGVRSDRARRGYRGHLYNWYETTTLSRSSRGTSRRWTAATSRAT
jgi:hypothetical protein